MKRFFGVCLMLFCLFGRALAAEPEDFFYKGVALGDSHEQLVEKLGEARVDIDKTVDGRMITYYFYDRKEVKIGVARDSGLVVDIRSTDKEYTAKNGVKIGATPHKILKEYGKTVRRKMGGKIYYMYEHPLRPEQKLLLDVSDGFLEEIRITDLKE